MKNQRPDLKDTLGKKVPLQSESRDITEIDKQITEIHSKPEGKIVRTTIHLPKHIHTRIKVFCATNGTSFKEFVTDKLISSLQDI